MAITNHKHIPENRTIIVIMTSGSRVPCTCLDNDREAETLRVELDEGYFAQISYAEIDRTILPLTRR